MHAKTAAHKMPIAIAHAPRPGKDLVVRPAAILKVTVRTTAHSIATYAFVIAGQAAKMVDRSHAPVIAIVRVHGRRPFASFALSTPGTAKIAQHSMLQVAAAIAGRPSLAKTVVSAKPTSAADVPARVVGPTTSVRSAVETPHFACAAAL